jgi:hypothetical protein
MKSLGCVGVSVASKSFLWHREYCLFAVFNFPFRFIQFLCTGSCGALFYCRPLCHMPAPNEPPRIAISQNSPSLPFPQSLSRQ